MSVLHDLEDIALELDFSVKVGIVELLHGDLGALVLSQAGGLQVDVVVKGFAGEGDLFVDSSSVLGREVPVADSEGDEEKDKEDPVGGPSGFERKETLNQPRADQVDSGEVVVGEGGVALGGERGVRDRSDIGAARELGVWYDMSRVWTSRTS